MSDEKKTVGVYCALRNGIAIHIDEMVDNGLGQKIARRKGPIVALDYGDNPDVDAGFWAEWLSLHENDPLVTQGVLKETDGDAQRRD